MTHTSTEQIEPRYADVVHHANVHPSLSYVARKTGLGYQETTRLLELALARGDLASGDYAGRNLDLYVADRVKALTQEVEQLRARVQELEAERTARMTQNDRMAERIAELEAQVQRAAEAERAAILLRVKNRACAGALLVKDFQEIVNDRWQNTCAATQPAAKLVQPTERELIDFATEEEFLLFCDEEEFTQIARSVLQKFATRAALAAQAKQGGAA